MTIIYIKLKIYNAVRYDFSALRNGIAGRLNHGVGIAPNGASQVVSSADFNRLIHRRF